MADRSSSGGMPLWLAWVLAPVSCLALLALVVAGALQFAVRAVGPGVASFGLALLAFVLFLACYSRIDRQKTLRIRAQARRRAAAARSGVKALPVTADRLKARLRVFRWGGGLVVIGLCVVALWLPAARAWREEDYVDAAIFGLMSLAMLVGLLGLARLGSAADRAGALLRMDANGFHHCLLPTIPWPAVRGVQLHDSGHDGRARYELVLTLDFAFGSRLTMPAWRRAFDWCVPRVDGSCTRLVIPLGLVRAHPHQVAGAAVTLADRHGGVRTPRSPDGRPLA